MTGLIASSAALTAKTYADSFCESFGYIDEQITTISLPRGGAVGLDYSSDGAKDHIGTAWPAMQSGPFNISSMTEAYGYDRAGRRNFIGDNSGGRALVFHNGRLVNTIYNSGLLQGYEIIPGRDTTGRHTGTMIKRDGNAIHTTEKALYGVSNQILDLASSGITATPQRDGAGRITGYVWSDGTNSVTQQWQRGPGGRIEAATNNVPGAPQFTYLLDPNDPEGSFDAFGRRLKSQTAGGTWTYQYGLGGQLTSATHPTLGSFTYAFDAIGRRTDVGGTSNSENILNQTTAWEHTQAKTLTIKAHPDARVWFNGVELQNFTGQHQAALTPPSTEGGWVPWETLAVLEGAGEGAGNPPANPLASPDAKAEQSGAVWVPPTQETFTFDAAGNRESSAQWDFGWDAKNQLVRIRTKDHATAPQAFDIRFTYDSEGRRVQKHVIEFQNGTVSSEKIITFVWDGWDLLYERHQLPSGLTLLERKYLWGPDIANGSAGGAGGLLLIRETKGNTTTEIIPLYDGSGNITALADIHKNLLAEYVHGPFGERVYASGPLAQSNPWRWATKYLDSETGLYYFGHRFMDPVTGQWLSRDPLGEGEAINLYAYCDNDPIHSVDVLGLRKKDVVARDPELRSRRNANGEWMVRIDNIDTGFWGNKYDIQSWRWEAVNTPQNRFRLLGYRDFNESGGDLTEGNQMWVNVAEATGWDENAGKEGFMLAAGSMGTLVAGPSAIAYGITSAPAAYLSTTNFVYTNYLHIGTVGLAAQQGYQRVAPMLTRVANSPTLHGFASDGTFVSPVRPGAMGGWFQRGHIINPFFKSNASTGTSLTKSMSPEIRLLSEAHITNSGVTVLGSYRPAPGYLSYIDKARKRGASYFDIGDTWDRLTPAQRESANLHFLDVIGGRGDKIILSVPKSEIIPGTALHTEIKYLENVLNYRWLNQWSLQPK